MDSITLNQNLDENQNLVHKMIKQTLPSHDLHIGILSYDDLFQEGMFGLWRAYKRYDPSKKVKFSTFACVQIKCAILDCLNQQQFSIKYPCHFKPAEKREFESNTLYLDQPTKDSSEDSTNTLMDVLQSDLLFHLDNSEIDLDESLDIRESLSVLNEKEKYAIEQYYFEDRTAADISKDEGVSRQSIEQRMRSGYKKLSLSKRLAFA